MLDTWILQAGNGLRGNHASIVHRERIDTTWQPVVTVEAAHAYEAYPAIAGDPDLLIADEPTGDVDGAATDSIMDMIGRLNAERGITACIACHGPRGLGNPLAGYPAVAGQHAVYLANQLRLYASGERTSDPNQMMRNIASRMTENDIRAAASYMQGLRW